MLKDINPEYSLEGLMLKLQYFGSLMQRADSLEKTLMLRRIEDNMTQIPLLGIHTEETRTERDTYTPMFIAMLFIIARTWRQARCPWQMDG